MIVLIDNYDSFVHNLARYVRELGEETVVVRNDAIGVADVVALAPTHIVVSPGPCTPREAGISNDVIAVLGESTPILGVCLGHQCIAHVFGGEIVRAPRPVHGKSSAIVHDGSGMFEGVPSPFTAGRYHSLTVRRATLPAALEVIATTVDGEIMALRHRRRPIWGVQFHPESILTRHGYTLLRNFLAPPAGSVQPSNRIQSQRATERCEDAGAETNGEPDSAPPLLGVLHDSNSIRARDEISESHRGRARSSLARRATEAYQEVRRRERNRGPRATNVAWGESAASGLRSRPNVAIISSRALRLSSEDA